MLEKTLENSLDGKEIKPINPKGNQLWILIGRTDAKAETPGLWSPDAKSQLIGKDPDAGKDWRQKEKGAEEDEMVRWHHQLNGHEFEQTPREWRTEMSGMLQSMVLQRVRYVLATEKQQIAKLRALKNFPFSVWACVYIHCLVDWLHQYECVSYSQINIKIFTLHYLSISTLKGFSPSPSSLNSPRKVHKSKNRRCLLTVKSPSQRE